MPHFLVAQHVLARAGMACEGKAWSGAYSWGHGFIKCTSICALFVPQHCNCALFVLQHFYLCPICVPEEHQKSQQPFFKEKITALSTTGSQGGVPEIPWDTFPENSSPEHARYCMEILIPLDLV